MGIELYKHNADAYEAALSMLTDTGRAAVIHPTGTGKSFIGFKLCEDNAAAVICWLSPSEYIFSTQLENLRSAAGGYVPQNIRFFTYAKLMLMCEEELADIHPDYIILDEFHRCGAEMWGQGVQRLLDAYPRVPCLGLSATNIRYLDNQRDMAEELFDGNIASEMTLGEAIVRGILNPPKYVQSVFSYQKDLEKYTRRVRRSKNKAVRDAGEQYLEALRRAIEMADGLDVIFDKHITDRTGKFIIFCANKEHMDEMMMHTEWFAKIDRKPHIYSLYSDDPAAAESYQAFKADQDTTHLRLLYAIDALNEGVHVEDVSGVILLRPTISPIIYKQQIGRALSASKKKKAVIFDIVNNIENLYSIGAIEEEMRAAVTYYRYFGQTREIVNERFQVYDEVKQCKALFAQLDHALSASWDMMYTEAKSYFDANGNLEVPLRYKTSEGYSLGSWLQTQRKVRAGKQIGRLELAQIEQLDAIGMRWESVGELSWQRYYEAAKQYYNTHGDLNVKVVYVTSDGIRLGAWISNLRTYKRSGIKHAYISPERIALLEKIGMIWDQPDYIFERNYAAALAYYRAHGDLDVPTNCTVDGVKLGSWMCNLRSARRGASSSGLTDEQISRLDEIGMRWDNKFTVLWNQGMAEAEKYYAAFGHLQVPLAYQSAAGYALGQWIYRQREAQQKGKLSDEQIIRLEALGMNWSGTRKNDWETCFALVQQYVETHGNLDMPPDYTADGIWLYKWLNAQKQIYHGKCKGKYLTAEQIRKLESIGMDWRSKSERAWDEQYAKLAAWCRREVNDSALAENPCSRWLIVQRQKHRNGQLTETQVARLNALGILRNREDSLAYAKISAEQKPWCGENGNLWSAN